MPAEKDEFCPNCHIVVVKGDPERVANQHGTFHGGCWKKVRQIQESLAALKTETIHVN